MSLKIIQSDSGYRYSLDSILLANFCAFHSGARVLDLGSGCGIITIILSKLWPETNFTGIEIQAELNDLAIKNQRLNDISVNLNFINGDIKKIMDYFDYKSFDYVISNPPYRKKGTGRININQIEANAKHELTVKLEDFLNAGAKLLKPKGSLYLIYTAERMAELINKLIMYKIEPKIVRFIHPKKGYESNMVLIKAIKGGKAGTRVMPPLFVYSKAGTYTDEMKKIFDESGLLVS